jgi:DNA glycosylase AlkZ-like
MNRPFGQQMTSLPDIATQRLAAHRFDDPSLASTGAVVTWLGAVQAQDYAGAKWSIGLRLPEGRDEDVEEALLRQDIVRTWAMRGTLHFLAAEDVHWMLALLAPDIIRRNERRYGQLGLDEKTLAQSSAVFTEALAQKDGQDRADLRAALDEAGIDSSGQRMVYMLQRASLEAIIGQSVAPKNKPTFVLLTAASAVGEPPREEGLAQLAARYFTSHGPAAIEDFIWWSGLTAADARQGLEAAAEELRSETVDGRAYWLAAEAPEVRLETGKVRLLSAFDEFLVAYRDRSASIAAEHHAAWSRSKGMFSPSILLDGRVVGLWNRKLKKNGVFVSVELFVDLTAAEQRGLEQAVQAYGRFLGLPAEIQAD